MCDLIVDPLLQPRFFEAAELAARAFAKDPLYVAASPDPERRAKAAGAIAGLYLRYGQRYGRLFGAFGPRDPEYEPNPDRAGAENPLAQERELLGFSIWLPPEAPDLTPLRMIRSGVLRMAFETSLADLARLRHVDRPAARARAEAAPYPVHYLLLIAVEPCLRGKGIGKALLESRLDSIDEAHMPAYLETQNPANASYYARFGFATASARPIPGLDGIEHISMLRLPRKAQN